MSCNELIFSIIIVAVILYINNHKHEFMTTEKMSQLDQRSYRVSNSFKNTHEAADKLAKLHEFMINYLRYIKKKFIIDQHGTVVQRQFVARVLKNYNPDVIFENNPAMGEETSYVTNKGEKFGICLREKVGSNANKIHREDILRFVMLHELSHLGTLTYGHNNEFWNSFKFVLIQATDAGLYTPIDYSRSEVNYCGLNVQFNPYFSQKYVGL
jgi:hypothetical protein